MKSAALVTAQLLACPHAECPKGVLCSEQCADKYKDHCPHCQSPAPHLHPAVQAEGEVQPCAHPFHQLQTWSNR
jgi:hypothetical protein